MRDRGADGVVGCMVAVFGTMVADAVHVVLGVPYAVTTVGYFLAVLVCLGAWRAVEGSVSIHSITTRRRELFYWATVVATVVDGGDPVVMDHVLEDLHGRGVRRLMVEGGGSVLTQLLTAGLADELQLVMAPLFVGDSRAPRFVSDGRFPWDDHHRARLSDVRRLGDVVLLRYALPDRFGEMEEPISAS